MINGFQFLCILASIVAIIWNIPLRLLTCTQSVFEIPICTREALKRS